MNKPYTCHHCGTEFDLLPHPEHFPTWVIAEKVQVKCPGCYDAGFSLEESIYTVDIDTMTVVT